MDASPGSYEPSRGRGPRSLHKPALPNTGQLFRKATLESQPEESFCAVGKLEYCLPAGSLRASFSSLLASSLKAWITSDT